MTAQGTGAFSPWNTWGFAQPGRRPYQLVEEGCVLNVVGVPIAQVNAAVGVGDELVRTYAGACNQEF